MAPPPSTRFVVVGAGAAGLSAGRELARAGRRVTILEARDRCGGRIWPLPAEEFGYPAEGGAEFVHGVAPVTRAMMREAGLPLLPRRGKRWSTRTGALAPDDSSTPHWEEFYRALAGVTVDLPIADFLAAHFASPQYERLRRAVTRTVEGYDAADPHRFSTFALRDEWMSREEGEHGRIAGGYGALIDYLAAECRRHGAALHLGVPVAEIEEHPVQAILRCRDGTALEADAVVLTIPPPLLPELALPSAARERAITAREIGFGNVIKMLLRFADRWWRDYRGFDLRDLSFLISEAVVPTWWTQYPADHPVMTGWYAGPKADQVSSLAESELIEMGIASLAQIFDRSAELVRRDLVAARAINWGVDPFARGAYSYATPESRAAQSALRQPAGRIFFAGEALYPGPDMGIVEAALANGVETAQRILAAGL